MNKGMLFKIKCGMLILTAAIFMNECSRRVEMEDILDAADSLMESQPDSALILLDGIDTGQMKSGRLKARFALLKSIALDKNYIDTTTFDVLQPAIDYYLENGTPDEKFRTLYYKGSIHKNANNDDLAMQSYLTALTDSAEITDSLTLARLLVAQGILFYNQYRIADCIRNNLIAADIYKTLGKLSLQAKSLSRALDGVIILGDKIRADSIILVINANTNLSSSTDMKLTVHLLKYAIRFSNMQ